MMTTPDENAEGASARRKREKQLRLQQPRLRLQPLQLHHLLLQQLLGMRMMEISWSTPK
jgi:hypothetical protein